MNSGELLTIKALAQNRARLARSALFDRVAMLLFESEGELSQEVQHLIDQILTDLIDQVETDVRRRVSARLATLKTAPHALTKLLANDAIEIARPILHHSPVLTDRDLIELVQAKTTEHRKAIARRSKIPAEVSAALAAKKEPEVVEALLANLGAVIPRAVFGDLVALAEAVDGLRRPLVGRKDMPKDLAHRMFWFVSGAMRHAILQRFAVDPKELDGILAEVLAEKGAVHAASTAKGKAASWTMGEVNALVGKLKLGDITGFNLHSMLLAIGGALLLLIALSAVIIYRPKGAPGGSLR